MQKKLSWIADIDSRKVNVFKFVQSMSSEDLGKYLIGKGESNVNPYVIRVYFFGPALPEVRPINPT
jgi:hypothetical protein